MDVVSKIKNFFLPRSRWKSSWQKELSSTLQEAQSLLNVHMIVVVAKESDLYSEVLFLLCFAGVCVGTFLGFIFENFIVYPTDMMFFPLAGFALGALIFNFREHFLRQIAPKAVRDRVAQKSKAVFFDHYQHREDPIVLLYISEREKEVLLVADPSVLAKLSSQPVQGILSQLAQKYNAKKPLVALKPAILELGHRLQKDLGAESGAANKVSVFIGPTDMKTNPTPVRIIKGSKDIN